MGRAGVGQIGLKEAIKIVASDWITKNTGMRASHQQSAFHVNLTLRLTHTEISYAALSVLAATVQQRSCCGGIGGIGVSNETKIGTGRFINAAFPMSEEKAKRVLYSAGETHILGCCRFKSFYFCIHLYTSSNAYTVMTRFPLEALLQ